MTYKFKELEVWKLSMKLNNFAYDIAERLPEDEKFNLSSQLKKSFNFR